MVSYIVSFAGLVLLWLGLAPRLETPVDIAIALCAAALALGIAARLGAYGGERAGPGLWMTRIARCGAGAMRALAGAASTARAALGAPNKLRPSLVRVRTRSAAAPARAAFARMAGGAPGLVTVEVDADGLLLHALDEEAPYSEELGKIEARVFGATGARG